MLHSEPRVLNRFQYSEYRIEGRLALAAIAKARETRNATFCSLAFAIRSEEHTSELQSRFDIVCRLLLEKKKTRANIIEHYLATLPQTERDDALEYPRTTS